MKRVLVLVNDEMTLYYFRQELLKELILNKNKVYISFPKGEEMTEGLIRLGCEFVDTPVERRGMNPFSDCKLLIKYIKIMKELQPDCVISYTIKPNLYGGMACRIIKIPYISTITGLGTSFEKKGILRSLILALYRLALKNAKCVFFQNQQNKVFFVEHNLVKNNYTMVNGSGVNLEKFSALEYPKELNFFFIGRIMKSKGIEEFIEAVEYIKEKHSDVNFHIVGFCEEEYMNKIDNLVAEGKICYHGKSNNIPELQKINSCTVLPSYHEGMSNVLLETCASARPCLCSDIPGCREIVENGKNGLLFESKNTRSLIFAIEKFILLSYEERKNMGLFGRKKIETEFDRKDIVKKYIEKIEE